MDKNQAQNLVKTTFENPFDRERFLIFAKNLFHFLDTDSFIYRGNLIPDTYDSHIKTLERLGKYEDIDGHKVDVLAVCLNNQSSLERARTLQRNFIAWYLNGSRGGITKDAALVAFYTKDSNDWRLSLVKMDYHLGESKTGKLKAVTELTPARRFSFLVGANENTHTAQKQLLPIIKDTEFKPRLADLESAFSVEVVTKDFFEKYKKLFLDTKEALDKIVTKDEKIKADFQEKNIDTADFAKKLLGQIVFLYFLQKKGWFGVERGKSWGTGSKTFLRDLFKGKVVKYKNFFNDVLEHLFYDALARDRTDNDHFNPHFNCKIPFLNGGLFDPLGGYDWTNTDIYLPNDLFSNKKGENDEGSGILDIFDLYNFTVKEDEPLEREVAVDPEMLGKVFENLLAVKDRKSKGTYYTPREIVHYMCQESLINYLLTELNSSLNDCDGNTLEAPPKAGQSGVPPNRRQQLLRDEKVPREDIETLIKFGESVIENEATALEKQRNIALGKQKTTSIKSMMPPSIIKYAKLIDEKLEKIRVCDPAVGSGAFLVGMMSEVIRARNILTNYFPARQSLDTNGLDNNRSIYDFKRHAIQNCLYGVDIDPGAIEIAKLRLWLSLIVDEENIKRIKPLPNLDYKIVQGNSLLSVEKNLFNAGLFSQLEELKPLYFNETNASKKKEYKKQIDELINQITNGHKDFDFEVYFSEVFHKKGGFDIIIANPPYVGEKGNKEMFREVKKGDLGNFYQGKMDLFYFFFHLALNLGKQKADIAFISTNYYPTAKGAKRLRQDFKGRAIITNLVNFNELKIFESALGQHNMITILSKGQNESAMAKTCITQRTGVATSAILESIVSGQDDKTQYFEVAQKDLYDGENYDIRMSGVSTENHDPIQTTLRKIRDQGKLLGVICNVNQGIVTGADKVSRKHIEKYKVQARVGDGIFVLSEKEIKDLNLTENEAHILKPWFKNSDIYHWHTNNTTKERLILADKRLNNLESNKVKNHLLIYKKLLDNSTDNSPYLHRPRDINFDGPKIVVPQRSPRNTFGYNEISWYASADVYFITEKDKTISLKYILALLNSQLYYIWLYHRGKRKGETLELYQQPLSEIPIKKISKNEQSPFVEIVDKILAITKEENYLQNPSKQTQVKEYEKQIDQMVYKLYGLTPEEIEIINEKS